MIVIKKIQLNKWVSVTNRSRAALGPNVDEIDATFILYSTVI